MIDTEDNDFTANVITRNTIVLGTDDRGAVDVENYNKTWAEKRLNELAGNRMNEEGGPHMVLRHNIPNKTANKDSDNLFYQRMAEEAKYLGGAKNKKKHRFRTKRRRSASRRKASSQGSSPSHCQEMMQ